jgi:disulfide oxidoreductase YuzD
LGNRIQITIISGSSQGECDAACGTDWSSPEALALASQRIKERFDERVSLTHIDLSRDAENRDVAGWSETIKGKQLSLPVLLVNGQLRISGQFDIRQLLDVIEVEIEIGVGS